MTQVKLLKYSTNILLKILDYHKSYFKLVLQIYLQSTELDLLFYILIRSYPKFKYEQATKITQPSTLIIYQGKQILWNGLFLAFLLSNKPLFNKHGLVFFSYGLFWFLFYYRSFDVLEGLVSIFLFKITL